MGWGDVARQSDLLLLRRDLDNMAERLSDRFDAKLESNLNSQTKTIVGLMSAQVLAVAGLAFAAARFA